MVNDDDERSTVQEFMEKNKIGEKDNVKMVYKPQMLNSRHQLHLEGPDNGDEWLKQLMLKRDNFFHPFAGLKGANVYLMYRYDKEEKLLDP